MGAVRVIVNVRRGNFARNSPPELNPAPVAVRRTVSNRLFAVSDHSCLSSRGWRRQGTATIGRSVDLTPAQALARYDRRVLRFRRDALLCDLNRSGRSLAVSAAANDVSCKFLEINPDYFPSRSTPRNSVSSRGWRSAPRDLTSAQALARSDRRVLRFRRDGPLCDLIAAGGPSPSARLGMTRIHNCGKVRILTSPRRQSLHVIPAPKITLCVFKLLRMTTRAWMSPSTHRAKTVLCD